MSTDDLTEALRIAGQARTFADPSRSERAIIALADEVDRLRGENEPAACEMTHTPPFDFAQCETHDTTFPLGAVCKFHERDPFDVLYEEVDEQRTRAVRAEMERDAARAALERVRDVATTSALAEHARDRDRERTWLDVLILTEGES